MKSFITAGLAAIIVTASASVSFAEPIEGVWKRPSTGTLVRYAKTGGEFCGTVLEGKYKGKSIGCMNGTNGSYTGKVVALDEGKTYSGKAKVTGNSMKLEGCVAMVLCKGENWQRQ